MTEPFGPSFGLWYRFNRYEIAGGYIRPAPGAVLEEYDPWEAYRSWINGEGETAPPYQSLLDLSERLELRRDEKSDSSWVVPEGVGDLLAWCAKFGLLGILSHDAQIITLAPRWANEAAKGDKHVEVRTGYSRRGGEWCSINGVLKPPSGGCEEGELVIPRDIPKQWGRPGVYLSPIGYPSVKFFPLTGQLSRFFPDVPGSERETYLYPAPNSEKFWREYAEPLDWFFGEVAYFRIAIEMIHRPFSEGMEANFSQWLDDTFEGLIKVGLKAEHALRMMDALILRDPLNDFVANISPRLETSPDGSRRIEWSSPSLLVTFAMMALQDATEQRRVLRCGNCNKLFVTGVHNALYCSTRCRNTAQQRRYRHAKRERAHIHP